MIDDQIDRHERLDDFRIAAEPLHRAAHRREIDEQRHAGEILQDDARDDERNFLVRRFLRVPVRQRLDIFALATFLPSQLRSTDSSTMRMLTGSREIGPTPCFSSAGSE